MMSHAVHRRRRGAEAIDESEVARVFDAYLADLEAGRAVDPGAADGRPPGDRRTSCGPAWTVMERGRPDGRLAAVRRG